MMDELIEFQMVGAYSELIGYVKQICRSHFFWNNIIITSH